MTVEIIHKASKEMLGSFLHWMEEMSPRDISALRRLKEHHLILLEVKITPVAAALGMAPGALPLPSDTQILAIIRKNELLQPGQFSPLQRGDVVILLTNAQHEAYIRQALTSPSPICLLE